MGRKRGIKEKIGIAVYQKPSLNKKILNAQKAIQEIQQILSGDKK